jgi:hypothetical protein
MPRTYKTHFRADGSRYGAAPCGVYPQGNTYVTTEHDLVTCVHCRRSSEFTRSAPTSMNPDPVLTFEVTDDVVAALKVVGKLSARLAERKNLCSTYDDFIKILNNQLPTGARIPSRFKEWNIQLVDQQGSAIVVKVQGLTQSAAMSSVVSSMTAPVRDQMTITVMGEVDE